MIVSAGGGPVTEDGGDCLENPVKLVAVVTVGKMIV